MKAISYARVSTDDHDQNPTRQHTINKQYCELHKHRVIAEITDHCTGDSNPFERENGKEMLTLDPDIIVFYSMDRFSRQHPTKVLQLMNQMRNRSIKLVSVTEPAFNMESEFSEIIVFIMGWFNNYFIKKLKEDIKTGMDAARAKGKHIGRTPSTFNKELARELISQGKNLREIAELLHTSPATINRFKRGTGRFAKDLIYEESQNQPRGLDSRQKERE